MCISNHMFALRFLLVALPLVLFGFSSTAGRAAELSQVTLTVEGMVCPLCERTVAAVLTDVDGVFNAQADRQTEAAVVTFDSARVSPDQLAQAINTQTYYQASLQAPAMPTRPAARPTAPSNDQDLAGMFAVGLGVVALAAGTVVLLRRRSSS